MSCVECQCCNNSSWLVHACIQMGQIKPWQFKKHLKLVRFKTIKSILTVKQFQGLFKKFKHFSSLPEKYSEGHLMYTF